MRGKRECEFDVAMIGNCPTSRIPLKTMPGLRWRIELARMFEARLGRRFAIFGLGWRGLCAQGPVELARQGAAYSRARLGVGNNNLHAAYYFSNRLPIAMSCGAVMLHNFEPGMSEVLGAGSPVRLFRTTSEAWRIAEALLKADDADYQQEREAAREIAFARLTMTRAQAYMLDVLGSLRASRAGCLGPSTVLNPWPAANSWNSHSLRMWLQRQTASCRDARGNHATSIPADPQRTIDRGPQSVSARSARGTLGARTLPELRRWSLAKAGDVARFS